MHYETTNGADLRSVHKPSLNVAALAELCLGQLAENPEQLSDFMGFAGYSPAGLRSAIGSQQLQAGLIDYFAANEPLMLALCANGGVSPEAFMRVWHQLNPSE
ncbi:MAG: hypothetical protein JWN11_2311 [Hyphomicrobiales bacterium]|nr:hypothetical protein [Hyphomicrobiales bacterium]